MPLHANDPQNCSERKTTTSTKRATSVPLSRRENPRQKSLRSRKQEPSPLDVADIPPSNVPTRGRKRDFRLICVSSDSQADGKASASVIAAEPTVDTNEHRPRKKLKRSLSTPPAPRSSQLSTQLQSRRRSRSRAGSPSTDVERDSSSRVSRIARRLCFNTELNTDIYAHLADPGNAGSLLRELSAGSVASSTSNEMIGSQSVKKHRGRGKRKAIDLADENAKNDLMEEWARMRQSQGILPLSGINDNTCISRMLFPDAQKGDGCVSSMQLGAMSFSDPSSTGTTQTLDASYGRWSTTPTDLEVVGPAGAGTSGKMLVDHDISVLPADNAIELPIVPDIDIVALSTPIPNPRRTRIPEPIHISHPESESFPQTPCASASQDNSVLTVRLEPTNLPVLVDGQARDAKLDEYGHSATFPEMHSFGDNGDHPTDSDQDFYLLDVPELFTSPWVPVASHLYVPPGLEKLISGMREQLIMETRARGRAEELYQEELRRRITAEKVMEDLQKELEKREKDCLSSLQKTI